MNGSSMYHQWLLKLAPLFLSCTALSATVYSSVIFADPMLSIIPSQCVAAEGICQITVDVSWHSDQANNVCLQVSADKIELRCNLATVQQHYLVDVSSSQAVLFELVSSDEKALLARQQLNVLHVPKRKPRHKAAWSIF